MSLNITYTPPDFNQAHLQNSPAATLAPAPGDGIAPDNYHASSNHPEYIKLNDGSWGLAPESRMDAVFVVQGRTIAVVEARQTENMVEVPGAWFLQTGGRDLRQLAPDLRPVSL